MAGVFCILNVDRLVDSSREDTTDATEPVAAVYEPNPSKRQRVSNVFVNSPRLALQFLNVSDSPLSDLSTGVISSGYLAFTGQICDTRKSQFF
jgi:hypothetical protein